MDEYIKKDFGKLIKHNALELRRWMRLTDSNCGRIYDRNQSELEITIDLYGPYTKVVDYSEAGYEDDYKAEILDIISRFAYVEKEKIVYVYRKKREGREQHSITATDSIIVEVKENGLIFEVDLSSHIDTGLFLDFVNVRSFVKELSFEKKVLNLFSYTASFSVYAASGLAKKVVSVDLSNTAKLRAERNLKNNGFLSASDYPCISIDALSYIKKAQKESEKYDIVIFDPPSFSNSNKMDGVFDIQKQYLDYISEISLIMNKGAILIFATNLSSFQFDKKQLKAYFKITEMTDGLRQIGFSKKRGMSRVWSLEKIIDMKRVVHTRTRWVKEVQEMEKVSDESLDRLTLFWDEKEEKNEAVKVREKADFPKEKRRARRDGDDKSMRPARRDDYKDRVRSRFNDDGFRREKSDSGDFGKRDFPQRRNSDSRFKNDFEQKRSFDDRFDSKRNYRERFRSDDRFGGSGRDYRERRSSDDRPDSKRDFRERRKFDDRPDFKRDFKERSDFDDRSDFERDFREKRSFSDRGNRGFERRSGSDFERRGEKKDSDFSPRRRDERSDAPAGRMKKSSPKPYGFDQFMETKSRKKDNEFNIVKDED